MNPDGLLGIIHDWWAALVTIIGSIVSLFVWAARIQKSTTINSIRIDQLEKNVGRRLDEMHTGQQIMSQDIKTIMLSLMKKGDGNG